MRTEGSETIAVACVLERGLANYQQPLFPSATSAVPRRFGREFKKRQGTGTLQNAATAEP